MKLLCSLLLFSFPWLLHAQNLTNAPDVRSDTTATESAGGATTAMLSTKLTKISVDTDIKSTLVFTETTSEDPSVHQASTASSLQTERTTTAAAAEPTTPVISTTTETTQMPLTTVQQKIPTTYVRESTSAPVDQGTSPIAITLTPTAAGVIPTHPPPTTTAMVESTSTLTTQESTHAVTTTAETIGTTPPVALPSAFIPAIAISFSPHPPETTTSRGTTDTSGTGSSGTVTTGTSTIRDPALVGGLSPVEEPGNQSDKPVWLWVLFAALLAAVASVACIGLLMKRRKQKQESGLGHCGVNGRKKRKKGEEDAWAGPVLMDGAERGEGNQYDVDEEDNDDGGPADGMQPMLSTFVPSEDEEKAVGANGTKEVKKWEAQSPLLYIDEDVEDEVDEENPANQKPAPPSKEKQSTGRPLAEESEAQKKGEAMAETGGALNGAVAFCQTTAV